MRKITEELVLSKLPKRPKDANKGTFGSSLIIAGSKNYPGAAILSCLACARTGVGLITLATDENIYKVAVPKIPFATFLDFSEMLDNLEKYNSILIGPGLGTTEKIKKVINDLINSKKIEGEKIILDADALNILSDSGDWFNNLKTDAIITPHPGEMSRLAKLSINEIQKNRTEVAEKFSNLWSKTIILKGSETLVANPKGEIYKSEFSNPLLSTAGTGDVLSGIISGLLAQGLGLTDAAITGVYIHGHAGEKLKDKFGVTGATSLDLIEALPETFKEVYSKSDVLQ